MPVKPRKLADLSDDEIEAERKRRKAANAPKKVRVYEMDEDTYKRIHGKTEDDDEDDESEEESGDEEKPGYFS